VRIYGINPVIEALRAKRVTAIRVSPRADERLTAVVRLAEERDVPVRRVTTDELDRLAAGARHRHQGVIADVEDATSFSVEDLVTGAKGAALIVVLDGIEDPQNVGAIIRTVDAAGADGLVRQSRHAARLDGAAARASAGAVSHVKIAEVVNIARALDDLKQAGVWTVGLTGDAPKRYD
jgi:23S rRNA (guanosine2251-2'-O)-methyltransferase